MFWLVLAFFVFVFCFFCLFCCLFSFVFVFLFHFFETFFPDGINACQERIESEIKFSFVDQQRVSDVSEKKCLMEQVGTIFNINSDLKHLLSIFKKMSISALARYYFIFSVTSEHRRILSQTCSANQLSWDDSTSNTLILFHKRRFHFKCVNSTLCSNISLNAHSL